MINSSKYKSLLSSEVCNQTHLKLVVRSQSCETDLFKCADCKFSYSSPSFDDTEHLREFGDHMTEAAWSSVPMGDRLLCLTCAERRMERPLTLTDFTPIGNPEAICNRYRALNALASAMSILTPHEQVVVGNCLAIYDAIARSALASTLSGTQLGPSRPPSCTLLAKTEGISD
jgi:hypothetical protein